jgi:class 3 adenylate cyclase
VSIITSFLLGVLSVFAVHFFYRKDAKNAKWLYYSILKTTLLALSLLLCAPAAWAQPAAADSIPADTEAQLKAYHQQSRSDTSDEALSEIFQKVKELIPEIPQMREGAINYFLSIALVLEVKERYGDALELLSLVERQTRARSGAEKMLASIETIRSQVFSVIKDEENAVRHAYLAIQYAEKTGDKDLIFTTKYTLVSIYSLMGQFEKSVARALEFLADTSLQSPEAQAFLAELAADGYKQLGRYAEAVRYGELAANGALSPCKNGYAHAGYAESLWRSGNESKAREIFDKAEEIFQQSGFAEKNCPGDYAHLLLYRAEWEASRGRLAPAEPLFLSALESFRKDDEYDFRDKTYWRALRGIAGLYQQMGKPERAFSFQKELMESMERAHKNQALSQGNLSAARMQEKMRQAEIDAITERNRLQRRGLWGLGIGLALLLGLSGVILRQSRELGKEKKKSETLLLNMLPGPIAERMKRGERSIADHYDEATVIFIDMVGFTPFSAKADPRAVVGILNAVFSKIDQLSGRFGMEKIKTIGDCYMAVAGIPIPAPDHLERALDFSLAVLKELNGANIGGHVLQFRIGVETGPAIAGIIGEKKFLFDLWGDAVNTASRLEANGLPGAIAVSSRVYEKMRARYAFHSRGTVDIKGKGEMAIYTLSTE